MLAAPTVIQSVGAKISGFGTITGDMSLQQSGKLELTGPAIVIGDMEIGTDAAMEIQDGQTLITGHTTNTGTILIKSGGIGRFQGV